MIIDFVGALATGLGLMGLMMLINRVTGRRMGRWVFPATVALGMIGYTAWSEYTWGARTLEGQPQLRVAVEAGEPTLLRPWTYIIPQTTRMIAIDLARTQVHPDQPDLVMTQVVLLGRWQPVRAASVVYDCTGHRRADIAEGVTLNADGTLEGADWIALEAGDAVLGTACAAGEEIRNGRSNGS
ncbi:MAG: hypothetical protein H6898_10205 [Rhodobacter sp.]|nr:hypothetical protein [Paracoccaceae bacterium]MCC0076940.1 hypothetical protein [Rhodobacter sp.]